MQKCKKIVYLDQNFVSNLAKARYLRGWKDNLAGFFRELYDLLSDLTGNDKLICPTSLFHREESELGCRVKEFLWHFVEQLGYGLSFKHSVEIMEYQIVTAARAYCGLPAVQRSAWMVAFNRNPQIPVGQLSRPALMVDFPNSQEFNEYLRLSRTSIADEYWTYKMYCRGKRQAFADEIKAQKKQFVFEMFQPQPKLNIGPSKLEQFLNLLGLAGVIQFRRSVYETLQHSTNPEGFLVSPQLLDCPYIHIWASLMAADIFFYPDNKPTTSLFMDFEIMASVLPYVDILATDSYISQLISRAKLLDRFNAQIFSIKKQRALVAQLRRLQAKHLDNQYISATGITIDSIFITEGLCF